MAIQITMPKLSDTMEEGRLLKWHKAVGERVEVGEILGEVETDKADMELEASDAGTLSEILVQEGESAAVGAVIAVLDAGATKARAGGKPRPAGSETAEKAPTRPERAAAGDDGDPAGRERPRQATGARSSPPSPAREGGPPRSGPPRAAATAEPHTADREPPRVRATPLARRVAATQGVAIESVPGTGPAGKVVADDVRGAGRAAGGEPRAAEVAPGERQVLSRIRATTARRMSESKREIPHFYLTAEIDMSAAVGLRAQLREASERFAALTFTHLILRATALALGEVPALNASYDEGGVIQHPEINIGIATATPEGLLVPVLRDAAALSLGDVVERARGLAAKADSGRFGRDEMTGGTFTVSNLGMYPVEEFAAVINPPQAGILAVGAIRERPVARAGRIEVGHLMRVTLSCDHRVVDGVTGGQFLRAFKEILERPARLLL